MPDDRALIPKDIELRYRQLIDSAKHFAIIATDLHGRVTCWNAGAEQTFGWSEQEMLGQPLSRIFTSEDCALRQPEAEMNIALANGYAMDERWHVRSSGERFWASGELTPLRDDAGQAIGFAKVLRDRTGQKIAETRLRDLTERLEMLVEERTRERDRIWRNSLDLLLVIDFRGLLRAVNPAWTSLLGYTSDDLLNRHFSPFVHPDDIDATIDAIAHAAQGPLVNFEMRVRHKDGGYRHIAWTAAPEGDLIYANGRDITVERRQAELLRIQSQARLRLALEAGQMGVWEWDMQTGEILLLHGSDLLHGLAPTQEPIRFGAARDYLELIHPDDRRHMMKAAARALAEGGDHQVEYRILWPDGRVQWLESRGTVLLDEAGRPHQMFGVSVNITRRKRTEQGLAFVAQASSELAGLVDPQSTLDKLARLAVPSFADWCAVDLLDETGRLQRVSVAHVDPDKVRLAHEFHRRYPPDPHAPQGTWNILRTGQANLTPLITDDMLVAANPDKAFLSAVHELGLRSYIGVPLTAHGKTMGVVTFIGAESGHVYTEEDLVIAADLARRAAVAIENARLYQALQQADRDKDVFLATLAHELRNPLAAIANGVSILRLAGHDAARVEQSSAVMERQVAQLARLVDDLLDISRITTGKIELRKEQVDLARILASAGEISQPLIDAGRHELSMRLPEEPVLIDADPTRLAQVFANILNNAAKYTNPLGRIDVTLECSSSECTVRVKDNGIGIAPEALRHIFGMFSQIRHPLDRSHGGLGIGLSLVERLVRMHGGTVEARSPGIGHGSEFIVRLPLPDRHARRHQGEDNAIRPLECDEDWWKKRKILVVDDNADAARMITEVLRMLGSTVTTVHDGLAAVETARTLQPDIVLLDIGLPGIDGYEAARRIRSAGQAQPALLIALTGWGQEQDRQSALEAGFDHHWVKPVRLEQLHALPTMVKQS